MNLKNILCFAFYIVAAVVASPSHAASTDYTLKYNTWELIAIPNPIRFDQNTPAKLFGQQILGQDPLAIYGEHWAMFTYNSDDGKYKQAEENAVFETDKGYWFIQIASRDDITARVNTGYYPGVTGPGGGIVFYVDASGRSGLEAAPSRQGFAPWGCIGRDIPGANGVAIGDGQLNTDYILVAGCGGTSAAALASNYRGPNGDTDGWFLPSRDELNLLVRDRNVNVAPGFYWTSSEIGAGPAWMQYFPIGGQFSQEKSRSGGVLPVRSF